MARAGIYVNGKEVVARYIGDKLVWKKEKWIKIVEFITTRSSNYIGREINYTVIVPKTKVKEWGETFRGDDCQVVITTRHSGKVIIENVFVTTNFRGYEYSADIEGRVILRFKNDNDMDKFSRAYDPINYEIFRKG